MHSSHTGWSSPTGSHSVIRRRAQRSAGRQPLHTTQSFSGIGMAAACSPKVAHRRPKHGLSMKGTRSMLDLQYPFHALASSPSKGARKPGAKREIIEMSTAYDLAISANVSPAARRLMASLR